MNVNTKLGELCEEYEKLATQLPLAIKAKEDYDFQPFNDAMEIEAKMNELHKQLAGFEE